MKCSYQFKLLDDSFLFVCKTVLPNLAVMIPTIRSHIEMSGVVSDEVSMVPLHAVELLDSTDGNVTPSEGSDVTLYSSVTDDVPFAVYTKLPFRHRVFDTSGVGISLEPRRSKGLLGVQIETTHRERHRISAPRPNRPVLSSPTHWRILG